MIFILFFSGTLPLAQLAYLGIFIQNLVKHNMAGFQRILYKNANQTECRDDIPPEPFSSWCPVTWKTESDLMCERLCCNSLWILCMSSSCNSRRFDLLQPNWCLFSKEWPLRKTSKHSHWQIPAWGFESFTTEPIYTMLHMKLHEIQCACVCDDDQMLVKLILGWSV